MQSVKSNIKKKVYGATQVAMQKNAKAIIKAVKAGEMNVEAELWDVVAIANTLGFAVAAFGGDVAQMRKDLLKAVSEGYDSAVTFVSSRHDWLSQLYRELEDDAGIEEAPIEGKE